MGRHTKVVGRRGKFEGKIIEGIVRVQRLLTSKPSARFVNIRTRRRPATWIFIRHKMATGIVPRESVDRQTRTVEGIDEIMEGSPETCLRAKTIALAKLHDLR